MKTDHDTRDELDAFERRLRAGLDNIAATTPLQVTGEFDPTMSPLVWPRPSHPRLMPVAAAAAITAVGVAGVAVYGLRTDEGGPANQPPAASQPTIPSPTSNEPIPADTLLTDAVAATTAALADSGRITVTNTTTSRYSGSTGTSAAQPPTVQAQSFIFSGDDWEVTIGAAVNRFVGGALYVRFNDSAGNGMWQQDPDDVGGDRSSPITVDSSTLFRVLDPAAAFTVVGHGADNGDAVTHLVATTPANVDGATLDASGLIGSDDDGRTTALTAIEVSIDAENLVRQVKVTGSWTSDATSLDGEALKYIVDFDATMDLADYGQPFTIQTPTDVQIVDANG